MLEALTHISMCIAVGYITGVSGFLPGSLFTKASGPLGDRFKGAMIGFTGGILIAFVCFEMLANALVHQNVSVISSGILAGVLAAALTEGNISNYTRKLGGIDDKKSFKSALLIVFGIAMHNIPEGMALGSLLTISPNEGRKMAVIIAIHCFPEAMAIAFPLIKSGVNFVKLTLFALMLSIPLALGSALGAALSIISPFVSAVLLSFAGGVMIYITCGEILPESRVIWRGRFSTIGACVGFIAGVIITAKF